MRRGFPLAFAGMRVGLLGGSFDPAHEGHTHVSQTAQKLLGLHKVWWLVSPQNPLKPQSGPLAQRLASARAVAQGRAHVVTDLETRLGVQYTADTMAALKARYPGVRFVFVMGADGMASFRRWRRWRAVLAQAPMLIVARPGCGPQERLSPAFSPSLRRRANPTLAGQTPPAWAFVPVRWNRASSSAIRARRAGLSQKT